MKSTGVLSFKQLAINIGMRFAGARVRIIERGPLIHIYYGPELVRTLAPDPARRYQPIRKRRGGEVEIKP